MKIKRLANKSKFISDYKKEEYLIDVWKCLQLFSTFIQMEKKYAYKIKIYDINTHKLIHNFTTDCEYYERHCGDIDSAIDKILCNYRYFKKREELECKYFNKNNNLEVTK